MRIPPFLRSGPASRTWRRDLLGLLSVALLTLSARSVLADHYVVPTGSMRPTVEVDDRVLVDKAAFGIRLPFTSRYLIELSPPQRGDVVVLNSPVDGTVLLKRIAAEPGDEVHVLEGRVHINGVRTPVAERLRLDSGGGPDFGPLVIPERHYLVLGDNRGESFDGRRFGLVDRSAMLGRAAGVYFRAGGLDWHPLTR